MKFVTLTATLLAALALAGCDRDDGPMEEMGKKIDEAAEDVSRETKEALDDAGDAIDEAAEEAEKKLKDD
jgi:hypothetical protein